MSILAQAPNVLENGSLPVFIAAGVVLVLILLFFIVIAKYVILWLQSFLAAANISFLHLVMMSLRKTNPRVIVRSKIMAVQAGLAHEQKITTNALEAHYLAGGNVPRVIEALIAANRSGIKLTFQEATAIDLAGKNVLAAAKSGMLLGQVVAAETVIQPAGSVLIDGKPMDAVSVDGSINAGQHVEIVEVRDDIVMVRPQE
ncbi:MAG: hypothetical protein HON53_17190 [Planctomycetaceae bacterium]|jgi:uncharacterized protein YqfA (UPF0365 family)|nr:hypothetical protein [Planctomycetaceae bacterium]MBT6153344.1 hypothetical protein [Planctomycetaceae bacterium]MBT6486268.1 hypothetical protein [Planctomycetaceae bacterium]MBT6498226.1 hypothetical protein [Planctomycetaceae bacterium]